jgi:hypothetical protein
MIDDAIVYIILTVAALAIIAAVLFMGRKKPMRGSLSRLASLSFVFVIGGIAFGDDRIVGYSLIGIGLVFAAADIIVKMRSRKARFLRENPKKRAAI